MRPAATREGDFLMMARNTSWRVRLAACAAALLIVLAVAAPAAAAPPATAVDSLWSQVLTWLGLGPGAHALVGQDVSASPGEVGGGASIDPDGNNLETPGDEGPMIDPDG